MMKLGRSLALVAIVVIVVVTSINCVQNATQQPAPGHGATPAVEPLPANNFTRDQKNAIYNKAINDPYVKDRILMAPGRTITRVGDLEVKNITYMMGDVTYMRCHEIGPGHDRWTVLPAAEIIPGNISQAGVNVIAFVDTSQDRVACIGFVPRPGAPYSDLKFTSVDGGVEGSAPNGDLYYNLRNATIVDTGYVRNMSLSPAQVDRATGLAMTNGTVCGYIGSRSANMSSSTTVTSYEMGHPYRYILAYPMVTIDVTDGETKYDTIYVFTDLINNRVVRVEHGGPPLF